MALALPISSWFILYYFKVWSGHVWVDRLYFEEVSPTPFSYFQDPEKKTDLIAWFRNIQTYDINWFHMMMTIDDICLWHLLHSYAFLVLLEPLLFKAWLGQALWCRRNHRRPLSQDARSQETRMQAWSSFTQLLSDWFRTYQKYSKTCQDNIEIDRICIRMWSNMYFFCLSSLLMSCFHWLSLAVSL